jgi:hypothetical protein
MCSRIEIQESKECCWLGEGRMVEKINGWDNSTDSENANLDRRAIHIHGGMEHNLARYAKYYSYGNTKILGGNEFTRETDHSRRIIFLILISRC